MAFSIVQSASNSDSGTTHVVMLGAPPTQVLRASRAEALALSLEFPRPDFWPYDRVVDGVEWPVSESHAFDFESRQNRCRRHNLYNLIQYLDGFDFRALGATLDVLHGRGCTYPCGCVIHTVYNAVTVTPDSTDDEFIGLRAPHICKAHYGCNSPHSLHLALSRAYGSGK